MHNTGLGFWRSNLPAASGRGRCRFVRTNGAKVVESKTRYRWKRPSRVLGTLSSLEVKVLCPT
jgi:hypothetical protein